LIGQLCFVRPIRDLFSQLKKKKTNIHTSKFKILSNWQITGRDTKNRNDDEDGLEEVPNSKTKTKS